MLDRYLLREVLFGTLFALGTLLGVLVLGQIFREIRPFLVEKGLPFSFVVTFVLHLLPFTLVLLIPWAFLAATLLTFGRMSSHQEITVMRASGRSIYRIAMPVLALGLGFSLLSLYLNSSAGPHSKAQLKQLVHEAGLSDPLRFFDPGIVQAQLGGQRLFVEERTAETAVRDLHVYQLNADNQFPEAYLHAKNVRFDLDLPARKFTLHLNKVYSEIYNADGSLKRLHAASAEPWVLPFDRQKERRIKPDQLDNGQIAELLANPPEDFTEKKRRRFGFERLQRYAISFAPLALCFVAIPLALQGRRRETSAGFVYTIGIAFIYFLLLSAAKETYNPDSPTLGAIAVWIPNAICLVMGTLLFRKAQRRA